ncbi:MAG: HAD-IC family P-type ATPase [Gemmatimonadetes bacterium]|nr:HAD-IC family P-type ATPase [Gemmatimonadota bacterium]NNM05716.1 HAD-IC family P-type ATPase [Gemmatimonadota bacterium]
MAVSTGACAVFGILGAVMGTLEGTGGLSVAFFVTAYLAGGWEATWEALRALRRARLEVDLLMVVAAAGAAILGHWAEGVILLFLFSLGNTLETFAFGRTRRSIRALMDLRPESAHLLSNGEETFVGIETLVPGDVIRVRPGDRIPLDGEVVAGESPVDESTLTGEAVPLRKRVEDEVFAGTLNGSGTLDIRVTRLAEDTTLARVIRMVEEAREARAPAQGWIERTESKYAGGVLLGAVVAVLFPMAFLDWPFDQSFYRAMTLLVVASPCALVISIPATIVSAVSNGARNGVLFKGGAHLDALAGVKVAAFDKTGTLTQGRPEVAGFFHLLKGAEPGEVLVSPEVAAIMTRLPARVCPVVEAEGGPKGHCPGLTPEDEDFLRLVAGLESRSEHHVAQAILRAVEALGLTVSQPRSFESFPGRGVAGTVEGISLLVGRREWVEEKVGEPVPELLLRWSTESGRETSSPIFVAADGAHVGILVIADQPRVGASEALRLLREGGVQEIVMITGDDARTADAIAERLGIDRVHSKLLPEEKSRVLEALRREHGPVAMVGDGVNDAPALATADVGIALGAAGTDVALETADVVVMGDDLAGIPYARSLSVRARKIVIQNLVFSSGVIVTLVVLALLGSVSLPAGVVGHEGSTIIVIFNGLRLLRGQKRSEFSGPQNAPESTGGALGEGYNG